jgi:hypothetical protein
MAGRDLRRRRRWLSWKLATRVPPTLRPLLMHSPSRLPVRSCVQPPDACHAPLRLLPPTCPIHGSSPQGHRPTRNRGPVIKKKTCLSPPAAPSRTHQPPALLRPPPASTPPSLRPLLAPQGAAAPYLSNAAGARRRSASGRIGDTGPFEISSQQQGFSLTNQ